MMNLASIIWPMTSKFFRFKISVLTLFSLFVSFLDAVALYLFARVFSSIAQSDDSFVIEFLSFFALNGDNQAIKSGYVLVISIVLILFLAKSITTVLISRKILTTLSRFYANISERFVDSYYKMQLNEIKSRPNYEIFMALNTGIKDIFMIGIFSYINLFVEILVLSVLLLFVLLKGGIAVIVLMAFFVFVFLVSNRYASNSTQKNSELSTRSNLSGAIAIQTLTDSIREIRLFGSLEHYIIEHRQAVDESAKASVALQTTSLIPKVVLETSFMFGVAVYTLWHIVFGDLSEAIVSVTFIVALGSRVIPSLLRLQTSYNSLKQVIGASTFTSILMRDASFNLSRNVNQSRESALEKRAQFIPSISMNKASFRYPNSEFHALSNVTFNLEKGQSLGVVGYTGSGKSTAADLILGFMVPDKGDCEISGIPASEALLLWGDKIGYVPQSISLIDGSLKQNILLGRNEDLFTQNDFDRAITFAGLSDFVNSLDNGLDHKVSRSGSELSGGQRQKIGIARAVLSTPEILLFDESTSSLDADSENDINRAINSLRGGPRSW